MEITLKKQPHDQQQIALDCDEREQLFGGAKRGGKSVWLCQKAILLNTMFAGNRGLMCRYNFTDLVDTTLNEFFEVCPGDLILNHHKGDRTIVLRTTDDRCTQKSTGTRDGYSPYASRQLYRGLGDPEDFEKVKGMALGHLEVDEPSEVPLEQYLMLNAQFDWTLPDGGRPPYMALLASNPEPGWVEDRFPINRPYTSVDGKIFIPSLPRQNPFLPPGYESYMRANFPKDFVTKYLDGIWGASEGAIFKELDDAIHDIDLLIDPGDDGIGWKKFCWPMDLVLAIDHGDTGVVAMVLVGLDHFGNIYGLHEYTGENKVVSEHCFNMREVLDPYLSFPAGSGAYLSKTVRYRLIDPSTFQKTQQRGNQLQGIAEDYRDHGFPCTPAWNPIEHGLNMIAEHLHIIPIHQHPISRIFGAPSLFISKSRCPQLWKQLRGLKKKVRPNGYVEFVGPDHCLDCLRYIVVSRPRRPELTRIDELNLSTLELMRKRSHEKWLKRFVVTDPGGAFAGMGFS
jgi:hypothetical protein